MSGHETGDIFESIEVIGQAPPGPLPRQSHFAGGEAGRRGSGGGIPFLDKIVDFFKKSGKGGSVGFPGMDQLISSGLSALFSELFGGASSQEKKLLAQALQGGQLQLDNLFNAAEIRDQLKDSIRGPRLGSTINRRTGGEGFRFSSKIGEPSNAHLFTDNIDFRRMSIEEQFPDLLRTLLGGGSSIIGGNSLFAQNLGNDRRDGIEAVGGQIGQFFIDNPSFLSDLFSKRQGKLDSFIDPTNDPAGELDL